MPTYVYGIIDGDAQAPGAAGIGGAPLQLIPADGSAALVSEIAGSDVRLGRDEVLTHSRVLEEAMSNGTVLPMRFGVVMEDDAEVRGRLLDEHAAELRRQLELMAGKVELNVRAVYEEEPLLRDVLEHEPEIARLRDQLRGKPDDATYFERVRLGELVAEAVDRQRARDARAIVDELAPLAADIEIAELAHERIVLGASFLIERDRIAEFDQALDRVAGAYAGRMRFKCTGPLPPHSFVRLAGST